MEMVTKEVKVAKSLDVLFTGVASLVKKVKETQDNGLQPLQDGSEVLMEAVQELPKIIKVLGDVADDFKADPAAGALALHLAVSDLISSFTKKDEVPALE